MIYAVADIHGCWDKYQDLLRRIDFGLDDTLYVLGMSLTEAQTGSRSCWIWLGGPTWLI